ncbi:MAG: DUF697 domain-containing protein [Cyanobacteria bacterium P01_D01_bin.73]
MSMLLQWFKGKPVWVLGAGVAGTWVAFDVVHSALMVGGDWLTLGLVAGGAGFWLAKRRKSTEIAAPKELRLGRSQVDKLLKITRDRLTVLESESEESGSLAPERAGYVSAWRSQLERLEANLDWREVTAERSLLLLGGRSTGKSALLDVLPQEMEGAMLKWSEQGALFDGDREEEDRAALDKATAADGVVLVLAGDLTATELEVLQGLCAADDVAGLRGTPCLPLVVLNKRDQWLPEEEQEILQRVRQRLTGVLPASRVVSAAAAPREIKVRRFQEDGSKVEVMEQPKPAIAEVSTAVEALLKTEASQLQWGAPMRLLQGVLKEVQGELNGVRRSRAVAAIEQSQWIAAAAAFANPVPGLDLVATAAVNGQLVMDLGAVYQLSFDLDRASAIAKTFGELMVKQGLVELSSQAIAGALKTNAMTYVAGGALQGISAAYLTRVAGLTLVELFEAHAERVAIAGEADEKWLSPEQIGAVLQTTFTRVRDGFGWRDFLNQAVQRLSLSAA